uniref:DDE-1 domain-containing protein n=1 Tax=Ditylenchus dipsaci TaxID=166011 RepID=A0A915DJ73_9BILA
MLVKHKIKRLRGTRSGLISSYVAEAVFRQNAVVDKTNFFFNLLNALHCLRKSWGEVKSSTIANCFRHAAFKIDDVPPAEKDDDAVDELLLAWARLQDLGDFEEGEMEDYLHIDDEVVTDGAQTLEDIVEKIAANNSQLADSETMDVDVEDVDPVEPPITSIEALKAMEIVRRYTEKNFTDLSILKCSDTLDEAFYQLRAKNTTQKKLTDYFSFDI